MVVAQLCFHVDPGRKNAFTPYTIHTIQHTIKDFHAEVRHAHFINIGKTKCKAHVNARFVLYNAVQFPACVPGGLLYFQKYLFKAGTHSFSPVQSNISVLYTGGKAAVR